MKAKKWLPLILAGLMTISVFGLAACGDTGETPPEEKPPVDDKTDTTEKWPNESLWLTKDPMVPTKAASLPTATDALLGNSKEVAVHDPSIFRDPVSKVYYAFGTHYAVASSEDLIEWKQESTDNHWENLYDESEGTVTYSARQWPKALDDTLKIVQPENRGDKTISTTWAPDVEYYDGTYYMYYSITKAFGSDESVIARVEAKDPMGPYGNNTVILSSVGATGDHPNCIDSELFYDKDGKLWMVYGSFFGGIYIKELYNSGENWGIPKEEDGWGKLLWKGGYSAGVEGPYIFYNATTEYYYLMTSEGDLNTVYNMRIARSKNPDGPYTDIAGNDVATSQGKGNKVAGNYKFSWAIGFAAMGHNSVIKDKNGRYLVVYHARRQEGQDGVSGPHHLYVSQLFFNEDGWPVMSPNAYVGEKFGTVEEEDLTGGYEIVLHTVETGTKENILWAQSEKYTFTADGKVMSGTAEKGTWTLKQNYYVEVTLDSVTYKGVAVPGWNMYSFAKAAFCITAVSDSGQSLWGIME